jgi:hypothetical protein
MVGADVGRGGLSRSVDRFAVETDIDEEAAEKTV